MKPIFSQHGFFRPRAPAAAVVRVEESMKRPIFSPHEFFQPRAPAAVDEEPDVELEMSDFEVIHRLGDGFYDVVYKVRLRGCSGPGVFALKTPYFFDGNDDDEAAVAVLRRVEGLEHVVRCHVVFRRDVTRRAKVFELMNGGSLERVMSRRGGRGLPEPAVAEVAAACLAGLSGLHSRGVVHLDVNPSNILADAEGNIKICDLDEARFIPPGPGSAVFLGVGTPPYMSPERCAPMAMADQGGACATDVWSLGITVLELYLGYCPTLPNPSSEATTTPLATLRYEISHRESPSVPAEDTRASRELRGFVSSCLQKCVCTRATVAQLLNHPFVASRDVVESHRVLKEAIVETMDEDDF